MEQPQDDPRVQERLSQLKYACWTLASHFVLKFLSAQLLHAGTTVFANYSLFCTGNPTPSMFLKTTTQRMMECTHFFVVLILKKSTPCCCNVYALSHLFDSFTSLHQGSIATLEEGEIVNAFEAPMKEQPRSESVPAEATVAKAARTTRSKSRTVEPASSTSAKPPSQAKRKTPSYGYLRSLFTFR